MEPLSYLQQLLKLMRQKKGSDLFISAYFPPSVKVNGHLEPLTSSPLSPEKTLSLAYSIMNEAQKKEFETTQECNFAISFPDLDRFRVNAFIQQRTTSMVIRTIAQNIPTIQSLNLPSILQDLILTKRGLILVVGGTGSGKSTTLAAMIDHRNSTQAGHIITVEDPVEYVHKSKKSLVSHREVGIDTQSWHSALKNTLRQAPDVILIGEIRDTETMEHAIAFAETGHLCLGTLHANNANQTLDRIINFFPLDRRTQLLQDLSSNLKAVVSQRLVRCQSGGRKAAIEILINTPTVAEAIRNSEFHSIKSIMASSGQYGMQTFDSALFHLYDEGHISHDDALNNADSSNELRLQIKLNSKRKDRPTHNTSQFSIEHHDEPPPSS